MVRNKILETLQAALAKMGIEEKPDLEHPANSDFGDYSSSIALKISKNLKKNPMDVAEEIVKNLESNDLIEKAEVLKPGFINFWITPSYLFSLNKDLAQGKIEYFPYSLGKIKKIMVEYAHPNPLKLFHIGHLRTLFIGESIARIFEALGNKVVRANYEGDIGLHVAKCLWRLKQIIKEKGDVIFAQMTLREKISFLGKAYSEGNKVYEEGGKGKEEIIEVNRMIYENNSEIIPLWEETRELSLNYFNEIYKRAYTQFDRLYFESEMHKRGVEISQQALEKGILEESEGAIVFNGKKYGIDTRVFINALGLPTYEGKELALAEMEFSEFGELDKCIHVVGPEQSSFFKVTFKVEEILNPEKYRGKQMHLDYGWVTLKSGKMSSRQGNVIEGEWLLNKSKEVIVNSYKCEEKTAESLAIAAVKYSYLKNGLKSNIAFDFDESISLEGNSGPYLIYTYVRCQSVLAKTSCSNDGIIIKSISKEEKDLLRSFYQFTEVVEKAGISFSPHLIATYLFDLAQKFNIFYQKHQILKADDETKNFRLLLTKATAQVIKNGLYLLGIETVEKM
ncbi:MAG: arginine--tRNA ligase [Candidatus Roizmanbacteria bacterium]|nr:MAG: arginine--tRNA ligase [Candidatus Roizmanbacteria bacterium]